MLNIILNITSIPKVPWLSKKKKNHLLEVHGHCRVCEEKGRILPLLHKTSEWTAIDSWRNYWKKIYIDDDFLRTVMHRDVKKWTCDIYSADALITQPIHWFHCRTQTATYTKEISERGRQHVQRTGDTLCHWGKNSYGGDIIWVEPKENNHLPRNTMVLLLCLKLTIHLEEPKCTVW